MTSEPGGSDKRRWLIEPVAQGAVRLNFEAGAGAEITPEIQQALERLAKAMYGSEVESFCQAFSTTACFALSICHPLQSGCPSDAVVCMIGPDGSCVRYSDH